MNEGIPKPLGFEEMEQHPVYGPLLQEAALHYLKTKDSEYFEREFSGERDANGYLIKKDGTPSNTLPSQNITGPAMKEVVAMTKLAIAKTLTRR